MIFEATFTNGTKKDFSGNTAICSESEAGVNVMYQVAEYMTENGLLLDKLELICY